MNKTKVFDITFDEIPLQDLAHKITLTTHTGQMVVTPNVDHLIRFHRFKEYNNLLTQADITVNDSRIIRLLSRFCGKPIKMLVPGSDLTRVIFEKISGSSLRICIIGGDKSVIDTVCTKYNVPNYIHYNPPMGFELDTNELQKCIDFCINSRSQIFFIGVGSPRQEILAKRLKDTNTSGYFLCIGASIMFLAGIEKRAPQWMQTFCLEWLHRLITNPRRLAKRYLVDSWGIIPIVIKQLFQKST